AAAARGDEPGLDPGGRLQPGQARDRRDEDRPAEDEDHRPLPERPVGAAVPEPARAQSRPLRLEGRRRLLVGCAARRRPALLAADWVLDLPDEPGAGRRLEGDELRQVAREADGARLAEDRL